MTPDFIARPIIEMDALFGSYNVVVGRERKRLRKEAMLNLGML